MGPDFKARLSEAVSITYVSSTAVSRRSLAEKLLLFVSCLITSLVPTVLLFLALQLPYQFNSDVSIAVAGVFWFCGTLAMYLSLRVRCFGILFLMSISLKHGRNLLIMTGTTAVIFLNIQNSLKNLRGLAKSLLCAMEAKLLTVDLPPLKNYIKMLTWVAGLLKQGMQDPFSGRYYTKFTFKPTVHSQNFTTKLAEAERTLNETVESALTVINEVSSMAKKVSPVLGIVLLIVFTALYIRKFRSDRKHNNVFLTRNFLKYDEEQRLLGKPSVFPLSRKESERYIVVPSPTLARMEAKAMLKFSLPIITHSMTWLFFIGVDALLYWVITILKMRLEELQPFHVPVGLNETMEKSLAGLTVVEETKMHNFSFDMSVFERNCLPAPELWLYKSLVPLFGILSLLVILAVVSSKLDQLRVLVSEQFFPDVAEERIAMLHAKILSRRSKWKVQITKPNVTTQLRFWFPLLFYHHKINLEKMT